MKKRSEVEITQKRIFWSSPTGVEEYRLDALTTVLRRTHGVQSRKLQGSIC